MTHYSLLSPIQGLTLLQLLLWPWIYAQALALHAWVTKTYGRNAPYTWTISPLGRVSLCDAPFLLKETASAPRALTPRADIMHGIRLYTEGFERLDAVIEHPFGLRIDVRPHATPSTRADLRRYSVPPVSDAPLICGVIRCVQCSTHARLDSS